ncbi:MAG: hypothetical protein WDZ66_11620 [Steroidobacteraceae bacterium]
MSKFDKTFHSVAAAALVCALAFAAVSIPSAYAAEPVGVVMSIDAAKGLVMVKDSATGRVVQVKVVNQALLKSLKVGLQVRLDTAEPITGIRPVTPK